MRVVLTYVFTLSPQYPMCSHSCFVVSDLHTQTLEACGSSTSNKYGYQVHAESYTIAALHVVKYFNSHCLGCKKLFP